MWPLEGPVGGMFVAGSTLEAWQREGAPDGEVTLVANAWVDADDWKLLLGMAGEAKLESHAGEVLAWKGSGPEPEDGLMAMASAKSFLVRYPWDLLTVNEQLVGALSPDWNAWGGLRLVESESGCLWVGEGTAVLPGVYFEGNTLIGKNGKIGPNCYLRGNNAIGDGCHIGQAVEVKNSLVGHGSSLGHLSYVGDSVIGSKVNFGAGTITSNLRHDGRNHRSLVDGELRETGRRKLGTVVGDGVHTGIHTAIYPGRKLGPGRSTRPGEIVQRDIS